MKLGMVFVLIACALVTLGVPAASAEKSCNEYDNGVTWGRDCEWKSIEGVNVCFNHTHEGGVYENGERKTTSQSDSKKCVPGAVLPNHELPV